MSEYRVPNFQWGAIDARTGEILDPPPLTDADRLALRVMRAETPVGRVHDDLAHDPEWQAVTDEMIEAAKTADVGELLDILKGDEHGGV